MTVRSMFVTSAAALVLLVPVLVAAPTAAVESRVHPRGVGGPRVPGRDLHG